MAELDGSFTDIGPECFAGQGDTVISWKGENFYKACGHPVITNEDGSGSSCVKRVDHPGVKHEDYDGNIYDEAHGTNAAKIEIDVPTVGMTADNVPIQINKLDIRKAWDAFVKPTQDAREEMSPETRTIAALLRAVNQALPTITTAEG